MEDSEEKCCDDNKNIIRVLENNINKDNSGTMGVTKIIFKCKVCNKIKFF